MEKGISELQQRILQIAYKNREGFPRCKVDTSAREVLVKVYGFKPVDDIGKAEPRALLFDRKAIGIKKYQAASVSVAKSFNRLVARGLADREYNYGIKLTRAGVGLVEQWLKTQ